MSDNILIVGDLHYGVKCTQEEYVKYQGGELDKVYRYALDNNIENIVFLGDIFDNRKNIYIKTIRLLYKKFKTFSESNIKFYIIVGNHDCFYKNTNEINTPRELFDNLDKEQFIIIDNNPKEFMIGNKLCSFVPWISIDNLDERLEYLKNSPADYCFGHFDINGFVMNNSNKCKSQLTLNYFKNFQQVFSGHFHTKSSNKNILYTGSLAQIDWNDYGLEKGFYDLNCKTGNVEFIKSDISIFKKILIGKNFSFDSVKEVKDSYLKIYINRKLTTKENVLLGELVSRNIAYQLIDNTVLEEIEDDITVKSEDFFEIVDSCVKSQGNIIEKDKVEVINLINTFYNDMKNNKVE